MDNDSYIMWCMFLVYYGPGNKSCIMWCVFLCVLLTCEQIVHHVVCVSVYIADLKTNNTLCNVCVCVCYWPGNKSRIICGVCFWCISLLKTNYASCDVCVCVYYWPGNKSYIMWCVSVRVTYLLTNHTLCDVCFCAFYLPVNKSYIMWCVFLCVLPTC